MSRIAEVFLGTCLLFMSAAAQEQNDLLPRRAYLGAQLEPPSDSRAGAAVSGVNPGTAAAQAGLQRGDRILRIDGHLLEDPIVFERVYHALKGGDVARLEVLRGSEVFERQMKLPELPKELFPRVEIIYGSVLIDLGYRLRTILTRPVNSRGRLPGIFFAPWLSCDSVEAPFGPGRDGMMSLLHALARESGYVLMRVDPPGRGDSEGPACVDTDFLTELDGYRTAFQAFIRSEFVDPNQVFILGMSNGGGFAPLVARDAKVAGYISISAWVKTWFEHMMELERRRLALLGLTPGQITQRMQGYAEFYVDYLIHKETPAEVVRKKPHLAGLWYDLPEHQYGRPVVFYHQLQDLNLLAAWEKVTAPVLTIWGEHDWIESREDMEMIAQLANQKHPGNGRFIALARMTHGLLLNETDDYSFQSFSTGTFNASVVPLVLDWMKGVLSSH